MATLADLRARLNGELGVVTDIEDAPWSIAVRNQAISDGYAALWAAGVRRGAFQDVTSVDATWDYGLTAIRKLDRFELLDAQGRFLEQPRGVIEDDGTGTSAYRVHLHSPLGAGNTLRVWGWQPYNYVFANDASVDDLPPEAVRVPLIKARAICHRIAAGLYARYAERQNLPPEMNMGLPDLLAIVAADEREFAEAARKLASQQRGTGRARTT